MTPASAGRKASKVRLVPRANVAFKVRPVRLALKGHRAYKARQGRKVRPGLLARTAQTVVRDGASSV